MAESKPAKTEQPKPKGSAPQKTSGRGRRIVKAILGAMPLVLMAWLLSAMAASAGAPKWLAGIVAALPIGGPLGWHFWAERRRKKAGKSGGTLTRHDRWLLRAIAALGIPLAIILVFFRGTAWNAVKSEGLWFAKVAPKTVGEIATERLRYIPKDARVIADLSGIDDQAKSFVVLLFQGRLPVYANQLPVAFASGDSEKQTVFLYEYSKVSKALSAWTSEDRRGHKSWTEPSGGERVAFRLDEMLVVATPDWVDAAIDCIESRDACAAGGLLQRAVELRGDKPTALSFMAREVRLSADLSVTVGYLAWAATKNGVVLRGAIEGDRENREAIETALEQEFDERAKKFPVLAKLKLVTKTSGDVLKFNLKIPAETLRAIMLQPAIFSFL